MRRIKVKRYIFNMILIFSIISIIMVPVIFTLAKKGVFNQAPVIGVKSTVDESADEISVAIIDDQEPYCYYDENGKLTGQYVETVLEITNRLGKKPDIYVGTKDSCFNLYLRGKVDILVGADVSDHKKKAYSDMFTLPINKSELAVYSRNQFGSITSLMNKRVGVESDSVNSSLFNLGCVYVYYKNATDIVKDVAKGDIDYGIVNKCIAETVIRNNNINLYLNAEIGEHYNAILVRKGQYILKEKLNKIISNMTESGLLDNIHKKWYIEEVKNTSLESIIKNNLAFYILYIILVICLFGVIFVVFSNYKNKKQIYVQQALEATKKASDSKTSFLFNMSHDIRTPVNAIVGFTELAKKNLDDKDKLEEYLAKIEIAEENLMGIINNILEMARIESGKLLLEETATDLSDVIDKTLILVEGAAKEKNIILETKLSLYHPYIYQDMNKAAEIIINIISNAIKYTPSGGKIVFGLKQLPGETENDCYVEFFCEDNGIGMSKEFLTEAFDSFSRERTSTVSGIQGTGLGLAIVKRLVDFMNGTIDIQSELNKGTRITVTIPHRIAQSEELMVEEQKNEADLDWKFYTVLLVEDNDINIEISKSILESIGISVEVATNGLEAVEMVEGRGENVYNAILMDIQMPVMDGYEATRKIRAIDNKKIASTPIIAITANAFDEDKKNAISNGMDAHLSKPIKIDAVIETLKKFIK